MQDFDPRSFRQALGSFATGVTIITTCNDEGKPLGLTVNSFNSVSMEPPMVLWSLANEAFSLPVFRDASHWAVHVLSSGQAELSTRFAKRGENKFKGVDLETGINGIPLLTGCSARFQCKTAFQYDGGDHVIFVGEVMDFDRSEAAPLVFHGGRYAHATQREETTQRKEPYLGGSFNDNFLGYLLGRSHFRFFNQIRPLLEGAQLSDEEFYLLSTLTLRHEMSAEQIKAGMTGVFREQVDTALSGLVERGYVHADAENPDDDKALTLTEAGGECALQLISAAKAVESQIVEGLGYEDADILKALLNRLLDTIDPDAKALWESKS